MTEIWIKGGNNLIFEKGYQTKQSYNCLLSCIGNYFNYAGYMITGSDIYFSCPISRLQTFSRNNHRIFLDLEGTVEDICTKYGIHFRISQCATDEMEHILDKCILNEKMIGIFLSVTGLLYSKSFSQGDAIHCINVIGQKDDKYYVSDGYVPSYPLSVFQGWIDKKQLITAWERVNGVYFMLEVSFIQLNIEEIIKKSKENFKQYICGQLGENKIENCGSVNMEVLKVLRTIMEVYPSDENVCEQLLQLNHDIKVEGFLSQKQFVLDYCQKYCGDVEICGQYSALIGGWYRVCAFMMKITFSINRERLCILFKKVKELVWEEQSILMKIKVF